MPQLLRPDQLKGAAAIIEYEQTILLGQMGSGKTGTALVAIDDLLDTGDVCKVMVFAPLRVANEVWPREIAKWAPTTTYSVVTGTAAQRSVALRKQVNMLIINYENIPWLVNQENLVMPDMVVFDELTRLADASGVRFKALEKWLDKNKINNRIGLTGSFVSQTLLNAYGQCRIINRNIFATKTKFTTEYFDDRRRPGQMYADYVAKPGAVEKVMHRIKPYTVSLDNETYRDSLPPLREIVVPVKMNAACSKAYEQMKKDMLLHIEGETVAPNNAAIVTSKLQQLACGFVYSEDKTISISSHKLDVLEEIINENQGAPHIVVYNFVEELTRLQAQFGVETLDAPNAVDRWNAGEIPLLAIHPKSAAHGLNLQNGGHLLVYLSLPWSLELYEQTNARLHRGGQTKAVNIYVLQTEGTLEAQMLKALRERTKISDIAKAALL